MLSAAVKDISRLVGGSILARSLGIISTMLFARILAKDEMAVFPAFLMIAGLFNLLLDAGIYSTMVRELPSLLWEDRGTARSMIQTSSLLITASCLIVAALTFWQGRTIAQFIFRDPSQAWVIRLMVPGFVAYVIARIADTIMWGSGRFGATAFVQIVDSVVRPPLTIALFFPFGIKGILIGLDVAQALVAIVSLYYVRDLLFGAFAGFYPVRRLITTSLPYLAGNIISYLRGEGDTLLVTTYLGPQLLAEYYIAKNLYTNVTLIFTALDKVAAERLARHLTVADTFREKVKELHTRVSHIVTPGILLVIAVTPYALTVLAGNRYASAKWPAIALLVVALAQFVFTPIQRAVYVGLSGVYRAGSGAVETAVVLGTAALAMPTLGMLGVALARLMGPIIGSLLGIVLLRVKFDLTLDFRPLAQGIVTSLPGTLLVLWLAPPSHGILSAILASLICSVIWIACYVGLTALVNPNMLKDAVASLMRLRKARISPA
jgi:O-antigen/teichoic acid export membrane protein